MQKTKDYITAALLLLLFLFIFGMAGRGDYEVQQAEDCYARTHSQSCAHAN